MRGEGGGGKNNIAQIIMITYKRFQNSNRFIFSVSITNRRLTNLS